ncbi:unnamed protein product [Tilletia controversa]|uniref:Uncharacterized protein n=3 Tax=Tilletia TaxID=13289 RepID=A0A8X7SYX3_9BASI|nr:hypothetical protein CF336_g610 [Tilletia laevis]KAE8206143.1 hypothetical protein CF328_g92 [Tilletia controversa]KAE8263070.1 hypothetical protein A4X03_0g1951 [Tilletia caries]KAE8207646.1 hypothetical protein CF335_g1001 [Tilletia laevis]KAE8252158.1 hypothetical protein A4X06_0g2394 [Tilletia controversa]
MIYSFGTASFFLFLLLVIAYWRRANLIPFLPESIQRRLPSRLALPFSTPNPNNNNDTNSSGRYRPLAAFDWSSTASAGLSSSLFDTEAHNVALGDSRSGLDESGAEQVHRIMQTHGVGFDEARLIRQQQYLAQHNIDPRTGMPLDKKAVTSLS